MGLITPRSEGDETPPPTLYGHAHRRSTVGVMADGGMSWAIAVRLEFHRLGWTNHNTSCRYQ